MTVNIQGIGKAIQVAEASQVELDKLKKATDGFEAIFLKKLFSQMRSSVKETQFGQTFGKEIYNDMFDEAMANAASKSKTLGMGDMLYNQFAPRVIERVARDLERGMPSLGMRPTGSLPVDKDKTEAPHDLAGRGRHEQAAHATDSLKTKSTGLEGQATHPQDVNATSRKS